MTDTRILPGCRVVDMTDEKGWFVGHLLTGMGAEVVRLEPPGHRIVNDYRQSGKHAISLDIEKKRGRQLLAELITCCDILIESFVPGYLKELNIDYAALHRINPALIMASISAGGQSGPSARKNTSNLTASAAGGQLYLNGEPDKPPLPIGGDQAYLCAGLFAANGILLAWRQRRVGGQHIDISIQECVAAALDHALVRYFSLGDVVRRTGRLYWNNSYRLFRCRDGWAGLSFLEPWETLVQWMDSEDMAGDLKETRWQNPREREKNIPHITAVVEKWTLTHSVDELVETGQLMRLPWAKAATFEDVLNNPQLKERGYWVEATDPTTGQRYQFPGPPVKLSSSHWRVETTIPLAGEYNAEVYGRWLGLSESAIENLKAEHVI